MSQTTYSSFKYVVQSIFAKTAKKIWYLTFQITHDCTFLKQKAVKVSMQLIKDDSHSITQTCKITSSS